MEDGIYISIDSKNMELFEANILVNLVKDNIYCKFYRTMFFNDSTTDEELITVIRDHMDRVYPDMNLSESIDLTN
tara:strand:+ start:788 stop:1012 length:225 start_codon:yes stop_codon:yes gene_type:complete